MCCYSIFFFFRWKRGITLKTAEREEAEDLRYCNIKDDSFLILCMVLTWLKAPQQNKYPSLAQNKSLNTDQTKK